MATVTPMASEPHTVLFGVPWRTYVELRENPDNDHLRMTYDQGTLEIMAPSIAHGRYGSLIAMVIVAWSEEREIPICSLDDLTCQRNDIEKGFEPDKCFYVQHEPEMWQRLEFDASIDPPPDLAIEVEMSRSAMRKITSIYAAFGVPEVWRFDGEKLLAYEFVDGEYQLRESSVAFPELPLQKVEELACQVGQVRELTLIRDFRKWVRDAFTSGREQ